MFILPRLGRPVTLKPAHQRLRQMAKILNLSPQAKTRLDWFMWFSNHGQDVALACRHFGIPKKTWYKWAKRYDPLHLQSLEARSRAPLRKRQRQISAHQRLRIITLRQAHLRYGKEKLVRLYRDLYNEPISSWHVQKVIEQTGLYYHPKKNARTQAKRRRASAKKRITELRLTKRTGFLFRIDSVVRYWAGTKRYILTAVDNVSKLAFAHMYTTHSSRAAADFLRRLHALVEGKIENVQTDNGSEFHQAFERAVQELKLKHVWSRVRTPKDNAANERFNRTLEEEFIQLGNATPEPQEFNRRLTEWLVEYNFKRPHQALGYLSPINFIYRYDRLLPMYPSSTLA